MNQNFRGPNHNPRVACPNCNKYTTIDKVDPLMAECRLCGFTFCTNCRQNYHGMYECGKWDVDEAVFNRVLNASISYNAGSSVRTGSNLQELPERVTPKTYGPTPSTSKAIQPGPTPSTSKVLQSGPTSSTSKIESVGDELVSGNDAYSARDISASFAAKSFKSDDILWPWNKCVCGQNQTYPAFYESLGSGQSVNDKVIETAMTKLLAQNGFENEVGVLENYLVKWGIERPDADAELCKIVREKELVEKKILLALINTDLTGSGDHWILGIVDLKAQCVVMMDTKLVFSIHHYQKYFFSLLRVLHVAYEVANVKIEPHLWKLVVSLDCMQQSNAADCGPLVVANTYGFLMKQQIQDAPEGATLRRWIYETARKNVENDLDDRVPKIEPSLNPAITKFEPGGLKIVFEDTKEMEFNFY